MKKRGISLIVLIVTIIVIIILAAVVILTLSKNNPIESAKEAAFKEDIRAFQDELSMFVSNEYQRLGGQRDKKITATGYEKDSTSDEYENSVYKYLSSFKKKYENKIVIEDDEIIYIGKDKKEREWIDNIAKKNVMITVKYENQAGEKIASDFEEILVDGKYEISSPVIYGFEPSDYIISGKLEKDTVLTITYYPWSQELLYEELEDGTYAVTGIGNFNGENLIIPKYYNEKEVTVISGRAFYRNHTIKNLIIPDTIKKVGAGAFQECSKIEFINLNAKESETGAYSFTHVKKLDIGENVDFLGENCFRGSNNLIDFAIYSENVEIKNCQFYQCQNIENIKVNSNNIKYKVIDEVLYSKDLKIIYMYPIKKDSYSYIIPDAVSIIKDYAFYQNQFLHKLTLPDSITSIGSYSFSGCSNIESIIISKNVSSIGYIPFSGWSNSQTIYCEVDKKQPGWNVFWNNTGANIVWNYKAGN